MDKPGEEDSFKGMERRPMHRDAVDVDREQAAEKAQGKSLRVN